MVQVFCLHTFRHFKDPMFVLLLFLRRSPFPSMSTSPPYVYKVTRAAESPHKESKTSGRSKSGQFLDRQMCFECGVSDENPLNPTSLRRNSTKHFLVNHCYENTWRIHPSFQRSKSDIFWPTFDNSKTISVRTVTSGKWLPFEMCHCTLELYLKRKQDCRKVQNLQTFLFSASSFNVVIVVFFISKSQPTINSNT